MSSAKRLGGRKSPVRARLLQAAEELILEQGYGALTTRRLAEKSGVKFQLIYYYFNTFDDLLLEVVERDSIRKVERVRTALEADCPLRAIWEHNVDGPGSQITAELVLMAKEHPRVRDALAANAEELRQMEVRVLSEYLHRRKLEPGLSALDIVMLLASIARTLRFERMYGMSMGHENLQALVESWLRRVE